MSVFAQWLIGFSKSFIIWLANTFIDFFQAVIDGFCGFAVSILSLFPAGSSVPTYGAAPSSSAWGEFINALNWFFPMQFFVSCIVFAVAGMVAYLVIAPLARWVKLLT